MAKSDNAHALRFYESLSQLSEEAAIAFAEEHPLSKSADYEKKFRWAREPCGPDAIARLGAPWRSE